MEFNFQQNSLCRMEKTVTEKDTAIELGSGDLKVFATPAMIALMENTAKDLVISSLPEGFTTVGIEINVKHVKASAVGAKITSEAVLVKAEGKKLFFNLKASDEKGIIGEGTHIRYVVNSEDFMKRV